MSLSYFTLFNPSLGPDEETLPKQLLFYTSSTSSDLDAQLRHIGLVQGIIEFGRSFSPAGTDPVNCIKSANTHSYLLELETDYWVVLCIDITSEEGTPSEVPVEDQVLLQLRNAHRDYVLRHGTFESQMRHGREHALKIVESWWMKWAWSWTPRGEEAALLPAGFLQSRTRLTGSQQDALSHHLQQVKESSPDSVYDLLVLVSDGFIHSGSQLTCEMKQAVQRYTDSELHKSIPNTTSEQRPENHEHLPTTQADPSESPVQTHQSWLSAKKWTAETTRLLGSLTNAKVVTTEVTEDGPESIKGKWLFDSSRIVFIDDVEKAGKTKLKINIFRARDLVFVVLMTLNAGISLTGLNSGFDLLTESLDITVPPVHNPYFFSVVHHAETGATISTLPPMTSAMLECATDTPAQITVKLNTIHLHRQIFFLWSQGTHKSCIKTFKNIWIILRRDALGTIILARSGKSGETMEEVEREGQRWILKLRKVYAPV